MKYLISKNMKSKTHIWNGKDTTCRMFSTKGLTQSRYELTNTVGKKGLCKICEVDKDRATVEHEAETTKINITQITEILMQASRELCNLITKHNANLNAKISCTDLDEPDYHDFQTCHDLQIIARELSKL